MATYYTHTILHQDLPLADITPLEKLVLCAVLETYEHDGKLSCFASESVNGVPSLATAAVREALALANGQASRLNDLVAQKIEDVAAEAETFDLDLSVEGYAFILQDIVRRSATLTHVSLATAFTCSKKRTDGFGGMVTLITPDDILSESTDCLLERWLADAFP